MRAPEKLPKEIVQGDWVLSQKNANKFRTMFKRDFVEITNDDDVKSLEKKQTRYTVNYLHGQVNFLVTKCNAMERKRTSQEKRSARFTL